MNDSWNIFNYSEYFVDRYYMHGSTWHPVIGPFGMMECVTCKCIKGQIDCGRLKCPPKKEMPCAKPVKVEGHCCPICTSMISNGEYERLIFLPRCVHRL